MSSCDCGHVGKTVSVFCTGSLQTSTGNDELRGPDPTFYGGGVRLAEAGTWTISYSFKANTALSLQIPRIYVTVGQVKVLELGATNWDGNSRWESSGDCVSDFVVGRNHAANPPIQIWASGQLLADASFSLQLHFSLRRCGCGD